MYPQGCLDKPWPFEEEPLTGERCPETHHIVQQPTQACGNDDDVHQERTNKAPHSTLHTSTPCIPRNASFHGTPHSPTGPPVATSENSFAGFESTYRA
eukprot:jgi/Psemu1/52171/gm1.52171_g